MNQTEISGTVTHPVVVQVDDGATLHDSRRGASFEELALPLFDPLYNFACWLTHNREEAEDLVQETFVKALKGFSSFQQGTNFRAWIFRILRNTFLTSRTSREATVTFQLDSEHEEAALPAITKTPEAILLERSTHQLIQDAIEKLPVIFREIVLLCDLEEMSYQEIADTLSIPIGTVMSRLARARQSLRQSLQGKLPQPLALCRPLVSGERVK